MKKDFYSTHDYKNDDQIDFGKVFRFLLMQSKLIISLVLVVFLLAYLKYVYSTKQYKIQSLLEYESFNQNIFDPSNSLQMPNSHSADIANLSVLYESRTNFLKVITDLKLNIDIEDLNDAESIDITINSNKKNTYKVHELQFYFSENGYSLVDKNLDKMQTSKYGEGISFDGLSITVNSVNLEEFRPIAIHYRHPESLYINLKQLIDVNNVSRNSWYSQQGLINVSYITDNIEEGKEIINYANNIFLNQRIFFQTEKSRKAILFIDTNIKSIENDFETNKTKLKEFREKNQSIDVSAEIQAIINRVSFFDESLNSIDVEITKAKEIYTENNPIYTNLLNKKKLIGEQKEVVLSQIEMMPKEQQEYIDLYNDLETSKELFEQLSSRRLAFSILEASTIGDIRVVDEAYVVSLVGPKITSVFVITLLSLIVASLIAVFRGFYFLPLSNPAELFDNNIHLPLVGVIPKIDDLQITNDLSFSTAMETLILNLNSIENNQLEKKVITITSPSPFNGKSTVSMKLAEYLSSIDKKVLLVDNDLKRGKLASNFNVDSISEKKFNTINESSISDYMIKDNFYLIPRVKGLNNSFQFLYSNTYKEKINSFKNSFDYIIFDTGPILSVPDTSILIDQGDINLIVVRHGINKINEIKQTIDTFAQIKKVPDGVIYNGYEKPNSYYGYYGIYGNYAYKYYAERYLYKTYEYDKKN